MAGFPLTRRQFLLGSVSLAGFAALGGWEWPRHEVAITGSIVGASYKTGHKLREGGFPEPSGSVRAKSVIVGGGIAGLSAAWKLRQSGFDDFLLLELEEEVGGNAGYGQNAVSAYPWGAHYVPLLTEEATAAHELFQDLGIITGYQNGLPVYNEYYLGADPHERLFMYGRWQEGIVPQIGIGESDRLQYKSFFAQMDKFKALKGADGRRAFAIPVDKSSIDPELRTLDTISMAEYLARNGWDSQHLQWYVNYCCRDDYGATMQDVSAWAGIHYFASRNGRAANAETQGVVTWPEGNGWIVKQLKEQLAGHIRTQALAFSIAKKTESAEIRYWDAKTNSSTVIEADAVILATPRFVAERLLSSGTDTQAFHYSPWMVANVTLDALPQGKGAALAWDNMIYDSRLLGYVVATHQNLNRFQRSTVLTYYWPLSHLPPVDARKEALGRSYEEWRDIVLGELLHIHPELKGHVQHLDVWLWGHGMIRPTPGFIWGKARAASLGSQPPVFHAHSDMSGVSIFEEANHHGVQAAEALMAHLHYPFRSSL
jgi:glycine/D-amino acid oxidase-like deaminating enzyme